MAPGVHDYHVRISCRVIGVRVPIKGGLFLVKDVVPEESVDHVADGDGQSGGCYVQRPQSQPPVAFMTGALVPRQVGQLPGSQGPEGSDNIIRADHVSLAGKDALGQEIVDIGVRVRTAVLNHEQVVVQVGPVTDSR